MRRTERLFQIIQILRRARAPVTAQDMASEMETSLRTVYRDVAELLGQRVPIRGEAGVGYMLDKGFDMPPLMLTPDEIEAAVLGASWVAARGDPALARGARDLIAKIGAVIPEHLRPFLVEGALAAAAKSWQMTKIALTYRDLEERETSRTIWPIAVGYYDTTRIIAGWCELRGDFRHFRTDRVLTADFLGERYPGRKLLLRAEWRKRAWTREDSTQRIAAE